MTTLAYKDNVIAYDSRVTEGNVIYSDKGLKLVEAENHVFILAGNYDSLHEFTQVFLEEEEPKDTLHVVGFVYDTENKVLYEATAQEGTFSKEVMDRSTPWALGSGGVFAVAAMDFGSTAEEAVKYAATRDCLTGGKVNVYKLR